MIPVLYMVGYIFYGMFYFRFHDVTLVNSNPGPPPARTSPACILSTPAGFPLLNAATST